MAPTSHYQEESPSNERGSTRSQVKTRSRVVYATRRLKIAMSYDTLDDTTTIYLVINQGRR